MERVFPIRCNIFDDSPHLAGAHQQQEIGQQRVVLVESPKSEKPNPSALALETPLVEPLLAVDSCLEGWLYSGSETTCGETTSGDTRPKDPSQLHHTETCEYAISEEGCGIVARGRRRFTHCEDEDIRIPGAIQSHGMLVALDMIQGAETRYVCRMVSENSQAFCKYTPRSLFALDNFLSILPLHEQPVFRGNAGNVRIQFSNNHKTTEPKVFPISLIDGESSLVYIWCAMHFVGGVHHVLVCEFELRDRPDAETKTPSTLVSTSHDSFDSDSSGKASSFTNKSEPFSIEAMGVPPDDYTASGLLNLISMIQTHLSSRETIQDLLDVTVSLVKQLTGYHRVMAYAFDDEYNGEVVAEVIDPKVSSDAFKGLRFPASDIPVQARELYKTNRVRVLFDREQQPSRIICRTKGDLDSPLDLTHSYLRAMSLVHLRYLENMGVNSAMSISLKIKSKLWGLVACHSYGAHKVQFPRRDLVSWLGLCASTCLENLINADQVRARSVLGSMHLDYGSRAWVPASSDELLQLFRADFGFLVVQGEARTIGTLSSYLEAMTLLRYVYFRNFETAFASSNIAKDFPDLVYMPGFDQIAGMLIIPLSQVVGDFIVFFRSSRDKTINWAGNPQLSKLKHDGQSLPRNSFAKYTEVVKGTCEPWREEQYEAAAMLSLVYGIWRLKEHSLDETRMKRLLLVNLSHEVRTPLNAVVNWLELALDKDLDQSVKKILAQSRRASKSLVYVLDDLLRLTSGTKLPVSTVKVAFDLLRGIRKTLDCFEAHALRKGLTFDVIKDVDLPQFVFGDLPRLQQAVSNLVSNAIMYTKEGGIVVHLARLPSAGVPDCHPTDCTIQISVEDSGPGMSEEELDELFQEFEQVSDDNDSSEKSPQEDQCPSASKSSPKLGLGLALLARYVHNNCGQIRGKSIQGKGSTFAIEIPMQLATEAPESLISTEYLTGERSGSVSESESDSWCRPTLTHFKFSSSPGQMQFPKPPASPLLQEDIAETFRIAGAITEVAPVKDHLTILAVDDNSINLALLNRRLSKMGHNVKLSRDGQQCFDMWQKHRKELDFVLMDLNMPIMNGVQATEKIRAVENAPCIANHPCFNSTAITPPKRVPTPFPRDTFHQLQSNTSSKSSTSSSMSFPRTATCAPLFSMPHTGKDKNNKKILEGQESCSISQNNTDTSASDLSTFRQLSSCGTQNSSYFSPSALVSELASHCLSNSYASSPPSPGELFSCTRATSFCRFLARVPIFAVSANLEQFTQETLETAGFDGWLPKPVDFARLDVILKGASSKNIREQAVCQENDCTTGGWFKQSPNSA